MPKISEFYGILILMYYRDHAPPHFHAKYGEDEVLIKIETLEVMEGSCSPRTLGLIKEWAAINQRNLMEEWENATNHKKLSKIPPLQ